MALGALAIPVIVHLIFRWQSRQVELGTIRFLTEILRENARRRQLKRWLLLAMRLACVALLALLFMRPYLLARQAAAKDRFVAILIDQSASMGLGTTGGRAVDRAVARARELLRQSGQDTRWEVALFDHEVHPLSAANTQPADRQASLDNLEPPDALYDATDYGAAISWARDVCLSARQGRKEVYVLTDLQRSGLDWTSTEEFPADVVVHIEDLGKPLVNNIAVTSAEMSKTVPRPGEPLTVDVSIFNFGPLPQPDEPVTLVLSSGNRTHRLEQSATFEPGKVTQFAFEVPGLPAGQWTGTVQIDVDDELSFDNQRHVAVEVAPPLGVLLVDGAEAPARVLSETYYLEAALRLAGPGESFAEGPFQPREVRFADSGLPPLEDIAVVVLANVGGLSSAEAARVADFVEAGGKLLVFTGENVTAESCETLQTSGLAAGEVLGTVRSSDLPFRWQTWQELHPLFEPFRDPQHGDLRRLSFDAYTRIDPAADARVLASFRDGAPALVDRTVGRGRVLWFTSAASRGWSDWPRSRLFVPLVHQMLLDLAGLTGSGPVRHVRLDAATAGTSGLAPGVIPRDGYRDVVNVSPRESETDRCTVEEFAQRFELTLPTTTDEARGPSPVVAAGAKFDLRDHELWQYVALALVLLVCSEAFLANRTSS
jgi:hypothetical protein